MRLFLAIPLPKDLRDKVEIFKQKLTRDNCIKAVAKQNLHITLNFYGDVTEKEAQKIIEDLNNKHLKKATIYLESLGVFPSQDYVRVIWIGAKGCEAIAKETCFHGKCVDTCHLTLARVKCKVNINQFLEENANRIFGEFTANKAFLYTSSLTKTGPIYKKYKTIPLE